MIAYKFIYFRKDMPRPGIANKYPSDFSLINLNCTYLSAESDKENLLWMLKRHAMVAAVTPQRRVARKLLKSENR